MYNLKAQLKQPQMFVLADMQDIELPIPDELIVTLADSKDLVLNLLESLPKMFENTLDNESSFTFAFEVWDELTTFQAFNTHLYDYSW